MADVQKIAPPFVLPENPTPSQRYRQRFNLTAKDLNAGITWTCDTQDPLQVNANEVAIDQAQWAKYKVGAEIPGSFSKPLGIAIRKVLKEVERRRLLAVNETAQLHDIIPFKAPLHLLSAVERRAVELFSKKVNPLINAIEARQQRPDADAQVAYVRVHGDKGSQRAMTRSPYETCLGFAAFDPACSPLPYFPDRPPINGMIAADISMDEFLGLGKILPDTAEELRPTTVLEKRNGEIITIPLPKHPAFVEDHLQLSSALDEIAALTVEGQELDPALVRQLEGWACFFRSGDAKDEAAAVQSTIDAGESGGMLRVHIGPSESYWDDNTKFPYLLQVGVRDPMISAEQAKVGKLFLEMEASLSGPPAYQPRKLSTRGGFADPIYQVVQGGFMGTFPLFEPRGNNFPNYSPYAAEGSNRFILLDAVAAYIPTQLKVTSRISDEDVDSWNVEKVLPMSVTNHESGHLLGPQRDHITPNGNRMGASFGPHWGSADEPKADLVNMVVAKKMQEGYETHLSVDDRDLTRVMFTHFMTRYKGKQPFLAEKTRDHYFGVMLEVAYFVQKGALTVVDTPNGKRLHIEYDKWPTLGDALWRRIIAYQANGDLQGYLDFAKEVVSTLPDEIDQMILDANKGTKFLFVERHL